MPPPYSAPWSNTSYPGSTQARDIDDKARELSLAIKERMETFLVEDWSADPIVPKAGLIGNTAEKKLLVAHTQFKQLVGVAKSSELNKDFLAVFGGTGSVIAQLNLPIGAHISLIECIVNDGTIGGWRYRIFTVTFGWTNPNPPVESQIFDKEVIGTPGNQMVLDSAAVDITIASDRSYFLELFPEGATDLSLLLYAMRLTYTAATYAVSI